MAANYLIREARIAGISERTLRRAKFKLGVISKVWEYGMRSGERWRWELPGGVDDEADKNDLDIGSGLTAAGDECTEADA